jgi:hypothetical protein
MRIDKTWGAALMLLALLAVAGCSAIGFFPQKAAEKAADKVLDDMLPGDGVADNAAQPSAPKTP